MNKIFRKFICVLLLLCMITSVFLTACDQGGAPDETVESTESESVTEAPETDPPIHQLALVAGGKTEFKLVKPDDASEALLDVIFDFRSEFKLLTGIQLEIVYESEENADNDDYEILLGETLRDESKQIFEELKYKDSFIGIIGNKIVIIGGSDKATSVAAATFLRTTVKELVEADKANVTVTEAINSYEKLDYDIAVAEVSGVDVKNFSIVYSEKDNYGAEYFAKSLQLLICEKYGYELDLITDDEPARTNEIVVGTTNRGVLNNDADSCSAVCRNGKVYLNSAYATGYLSLLQICETELLASEAVSFEDGMQTSVNLSNYFSGGTENIVTKDGEIRILVNNIWSGNEDTAPASKRARQLAALYADYAPDVLGLQEYSGVMKTDLEKYIKEMGYVEVPYTEKNQNLTVRTPLFYNPETLELIHSGYWRFNDESGDNSKSVGWGVFKHKATGKIFCAGSTHFYWTSDALGSSARKIDATELSALVKEIYDEYKCPIIIGGDYNCNIASDPIKIILGNDMVDAEEIATRTELVGTHHGYPIFNKETGLCDTYYKTATTHRGAIDHIFVYDQANVTVNVYDAVEDFFALASTDHYPLLVDITLK